MVIQSGTNENYSSSKIIHVAVYYGNQNHHAGVDIHSHSITVSAESVDGTTPGAKVTWSTTVPPECVTSVTVEFRTSMITGSPVVRSYTTANTSKTEVILTGLQCVTTYYIRVVVTGVDSIGTLASNQVQVLVGGKVTIYVHSKFILYSQNLRLFVSLSA